MREPINDLLETRRRPASRNRRLTGFAASLLGHVIVTVVIVLAPALAARERQPLEFVEVQIVPLQALGVPEPVAPAPRKAPERQIAPDKKPQESVGEPERRVDPVPQERQPSQRKTDEQAPPEPSASQQTRQRGSPFGSALATSPFGTAVAGFDNPDFVYGYYVDRMLAMIGSNWVRPPVDVDVEMTIRFRIQRDGSLTEVEIVEPSGSDTFDLAGERAVRLASPLPPLPTSFPHSSLGVRLIIR